MPPIDDLNLMLGDDAAMPVASDVKLLDEPDPAQEMAPKEDPRAFYQKLIKNIESKNIAEDMSDEQLSAIGQKVRREYDIDDASRSDWKDKSRKAMDLAMQIAKNKSHPWPGSSNVVYPLMTSAA